MTTNRTMYHRAYYREHHATTDRIRKPITDTPTCDASGLTEAEIQWANHKSAENICFFFSDELRHVHRTGKIRRLSCMDIRRLKTYELIFMTRKKWVVKWFLTEKAKESLNID